MSYMNGSVIFSDGIQELSAQEIDMVGGSGRREAGQAAVLAGGALTLIGGSARLFALVPTPFSPALAAFGGAARLAGAGFGFAGALLMNSSSSGGSAFYVKK